MDRGRATCGGQKPTAPTTTLIGYSLRINAYYGTRLALHEGEDRGTEMLGGDLRVDSGSGIGTRARFVASMSSIQYCVSGQPTMVKWNASSVSR
jgi:hypothetical protein